MHTSCTSFHRNTSSTHAHIREYIVRALSRKNTFRGQDETVHESTRLQEATVMYK